MNYRPTSKLFLLKGIVVIILLSLSTAFGQNMVINPSFETAGTLQCSWYTTRAQYAAAAPGWTTPTEGSPGIFSSTLAASNNNSCKDEICKLIRAEEMLIYYVPNTFTPDGDEFNQTFQPVFYSGHDPFDFTMVIFDRWGEIVFETHDAKIGWDGTYNGVISQSGMYTYRIEFKTLASDERKTVVGHVNLLK